MLLILFLLVRCWAALFGILMPQGKGLGNTKPMLRNKRGAATKEIQKGEIMRGDLWRANRGVAKHKPKVPKKNMEFIARKVRKLPSVWL